MPVTGGQAGPAFPAPIEFVGSVRSRPFGFGISAPLSHLTIDGDSLLVSGPGRLHRLTRADVATVRCAYALSDAGSTSSYETATGLTSTSLRWPGQRFATHSKNAGGQSKDDRNESPSAEFRVLRARNRNPRVRRSRSMLRRPYSDLEPAIWAGLTPENWARVLGQVRAGAGRLHR